MENPELWPLHARIIAKVAQVIDWTMVVIMIVSYIAFALYRECQIWGVT